MIEMTAKEMAQALRRCGGTLACYGCPYELMGTALCIQAMQRDAAALIEGQDEIIGKLRGLLIQRMPQ